MKLTVLVDNNTLIEHYFYGEPCVSYFVEDKNLKVLFDVGYSSAFLTNSQKMNKSLYDLDYLVLSHGHLDHTWGLDSLIKYFQEAGIAGIPIKRPVLVAHIDIFNSKLKNKIEIGTLISKETLSRHFNLKLSVGPVWLNDKLVYLGQIPRGNNFENRKSLGVVYKESSEEGDFVKDDSAMAYKSDEGLVIITGCSHSGICNIIEYAKKVTGVSRIHDVIGGFHLQNPDKAQIEGTVNYFEKIKPQKLHACHCTDLKSKIALSRVANIEEVGVGLTLSYS